uniref:ParB protein n=1 Tax=Dulem virus 36 TaxID=3145754 RepID=A0AAU8AZ85_9CAUD
MGTKMRGEKVKIEYKKLSDLKPYKKNAKKHPKEQIERIAESIKQFGFTQPVIIDKNNCVVAGHGRMLGAKKAGLQEVPTVCLDDLTEEQIKAYRLIDNKLNESGWDYELLNEELEQIFNIDMDLFGFDSSVELKKYGITRHDTEDYKYNHILLTFQKGDARYNKIKNLVEKEGIEYTESVN